MTCLVRSLSCKNGGKMERKTHGNDAAQRRASSEMAAWRGAEGEGRCRDAAAPLLPPLLRVCALRALLLRGAMPRTHVALDTGEHGELRLVDVLLLCSANVTARHNTVSPEHLRRCADRQRCAGAAAAAALRDSAGGKPVARPSARAWSFRLSRSFSCTASLSLCPKAASLAAACMKRTRRTDTDTQSTDIFNMSANTTVGRWDASGRRQAGRTHTGRGRVRACCAKRMSAARSCSASVSFRFSRSWKSAIAMRVSGERCA